jgi:predicted transcriptional regulator
MKNDTGKSKIKIDIPYYQTPNKIWDIDEGLTIYHKGVYCYLSRCCNQGAKAFPSYNTIAKKCGIGRTKAIDTINELIKIGLVSKEIRKSSKKKVNNSNVYKVNNLTEWQVDIVRNTDYVGTQNDPYKEPVIKNYRKKNKRPQLTCADVEVLKAVPGFK